MTKQVGPEGVRDALLDVTYTKELEEWAAKAGERLTAYLDYLIDKRNQEILESSKRVQLWHDSNQT